MPGTQRLGFCRLINVGNLNPLVYQEKAGRAISHKGDWNPGSSKELPVSLKGTVYGITSDLGAEASGVGILDSELGL